MPGGAENLNLLKSFRNSVTFIIIILELYEQIMLIKIQNKIISHTYTHTHTHNTHTHPTHARAQTHAVLASGRLSQQISELLLRHLSSTFLKFPKNRLFSLLSYLTDYYTIYSHLKYKMQ